MERDEVSRPHLENDMERDEVSHLHLETDSEAEEGRRWCTGRELTRVDHLLAF